MQPIKAGNLVCIRKEYQDAGDDLTRWIAVDDAEKGRVTIQPLDLPLAILPTYVVRVEWLETV
jgi:hypothetical protein